MKDYQEFVKRVKEDTEEMIRYAPEYFPFEWIMRYKSRLAYVDKLAMCEEEEEDYKIHLSHAKVFCQKLLKERPNSEYAELWEEAIEEIEKLGF